MHIPTIGELYSRVIEYFGDSQAIVEGTRSFTYNELGEKATYLARGLQDQGIEKGECIAFLMANCSEYIFTEYAMCQVGAVRIPLAVLLSPNDHIYMMNQAECSTIVYHYSMLDRVLKMTPEVNVIGTFKSFNKQQRHHY